MARLALSHCAAIEKRDVQEERQRMVQAMRVELDKVRGEINDDFKKAVGR